MEPSQEITDLLLRWNNGDADALGKLTPLVYQELRRMARTLLANERPGHTLSATALVHEAYLKLIDQNQVQWKNRVHFFGAAANIMRRILVDHAKAKFAAKRGGSSTKIAIDQESLPAETAFIEEVLALDAALEKLAALDARKVQVVEMKFYGGMTNQEIALALGMSDATVERDWKMARAWLIQMLAGKMNIATE